MSPLEVNKNNIWEYKQNKPSLIAKDFKRFGIPEEITFKILLARGVFKWLAVRRDIIKLKNIWRDEITKTIREIRKAKEKCDYSKLQYLRGYLKACEEHRKIIRELCHSDRWRSPDCDLKASEFLKSIEKLTI